MLMDIAMIFKKTSHVVYLFISLFIFYLIVPANTFYSKYGTDNSKMGQVNDLGYITKLIESDERLIQEKEDKANLGEKLASHIFGTVHEGLSAKQPNGKTGYQMMSQPIGGIVSDFSDTISHGNTDPEAKKILKKIDGSSDSIKSIETEVHPK
ncbi:TPA: hypothetical protein ACJEU7_003008 [Acinetobacter baumannii]|uniref:hypothetical protein n=1 Tax=Acinetobacter baumannii TaxID=470 RepID=UPI0022528C96|nr:hypothetical protein [Acinetobacter baumannii]MCX3035231.1 hypothetical protein [Acinetobacter baumannii]